MEIHVRKWGNSAAVRIPSAIMAAAELNINQVIDGREEDGRIIIEPVKTPVYDLDELIDQMTPETFHDEIDFGPAIGQEVW